MGEQVFGFIESDCVDLARMRRAWWAGQLGPGARPAQRLDRSSLHAYLLLSSLGPDTPEAITGGTLIKADAMRLEWSDGPTWFVRSYQKTPDFKLKVVGVVSPSFDGDDTAIEEFVKDQGDGINYCVVGTGDANCWFIVGPPDAEPIEITVEEPNDGTVVAYRIDLRPVDGTTEEVISPHPIAWPHPFTAGKIVLAVTMTIRGAIALIDGDRPRPFWVRTTGEIVGGTPTSPETFQANPYAAIGNEWPRQTELLDMELTIVNRLSDLERADPVDAYVAWDDVLCEFIPLILNC